MRKLIALLLTLAMMCCLLPAAVAEGAIDTSEHVKIVYLVTGDKPTNRTDEVLAKINEKLTERSTPNSSSAGSSGPTGRPSTTWRWRPRAATST